MINDFKQLEIIESQLTRALDIVLKQKVRYERLQSNLCQYDWCCEDANGDNEIANGILSALGGLECAIENIYL